MLDLLISLELLLLFSKSADKALFLYLPISNLLYLTVSWKLPELEDDVGLQGDTGLVCEDSVWWDLAWW